MATEFSFTKLEDGWGIKASGDLGQANQHAGQSVVVRKRNGESKTVELAGVLDQWNGGRAAVYAIKRRFAERPITMRGGHPREGHSQYRQTISERTVGVTEPGVYERDGVVYVVKPTRDKQRFYAKRLVEIGGDRLTLTDDVVQIEFEYARGAIFELEPGDKMELERAKALTIRYGRCIVCGRRLKAAESVERGIGPVCGRFFS